MPSELKAAAERFIRFAEDDYPAVPLDGQARVAAIALAKHCLASLATPSPSLEACVAEIKQVSRQTWFACGLSKNEAQDIARRHWPTAPAVEPPDHFPDVSKMVQPSEATELADEMDGANSLVSCIDRSGRTVSLRSANAMMKDAAAMLRSQAAEIERLNGDLLQIQKCDEVYLATVDAGRVRALEILNAGNYDNIDHAAQKAMDEIAGLKAELDKWRPMTNEEAQAAYDAAEAVPISDEEIDRILKFATDPANRCTNSEQAQMVGEIRRLGAKLNKSEAAHAAMVERLISIFSRLGTVYMTEKAARQVAALSDEAAVALAESVPQAAKEGE